MNKIFKKFLIDKLFYKIDTKKINGKANDFPTEPSSTYCIPLLTSSTANHGFARYAKEEQCKTILQNCISIAANGDSGTTFYQPFRFAVLQDAYAINTIDMPLNHEVGIYLAAVINKVLRSKYSWNYKANWNKVKNEYISLPIKTDINGNAYIDKKAKYSNEGFVPDFEYMQERVKELEQERVKELEQERVKELDAYLKVTGLNDYKLTEEDKKVKTIHKINKTFEIGSLFEKVETKKVQGKANDFPEKESEEYCIPLLTAGIENHGFARYAKKEQCPETISNVISISANGANSGASFYQPYQFAVLQDAYAVKVKDYTIPNEEVGIYLSAVLNKSLKGTHGWTYKAGWNRVKYEKVSVPIKTDENGTPVIDPDHKWNGDGYIPDWDYMQKITKVYEKEVIANVVKKKDEIIEKTKEIVNKD